MPEAFQQPGSFEAQGFRMVHRLIDAPCHLSQEIDLPEFVDERGSLVEIFRVSKLPHFHSNHVLQGYYSVTKPGVVRGPHEHRWQYDNFVFIGKFCVYLWQPAQFQDMFREKRVFDTTKPKKLLTIPPGTVHAYKNIGETDGIVMNFASQYYGGRSGQERVDEIRHEKNSNSIYQLWD